MQLSQGIHLIGVRLRQMCISDRHASDRHASQTGMQLLQDIHLIGVHLKQACSSQGVHLQILKMKKVGKKSWKKIKFLGKPPYPLHWGHLALMSWQKFLKA